jgi:hypothetical protein
MQYVVAGFSALLIGLVIGYLSEWTGSGIQLLTLFIFFAAVFASYKQQCFRDYQENISIIFNLTKFISLATIYTYFLVGFLSRARC